MVEIPYNKIIEFLRGIVPFNELPHEVLSGLPQKISIDYFPINRTSPEFNVRAYEDTVCYLLPRETFDELMQNHAGFHEHFAIRLSKLAYRLKKARAAIFTPRGVSDTVIFR